MAQIDLKKALLKIQDGGANTVKTGAINNGAGYATSAVTFTVDGFTGAVETGGTFTIGADTYTITAHSETTGNTTSITIAAPGLVNAVLDNAVITAYGKVESVTVKIGAGTLTYSEKRNMEYTLDRGVLDEVREGDEVPMDVKFDFVWEYIKGGLGGSDPPSVEDALKQIGNAASWVSSDSDTCRPYAVNLVIEYFPDCSGDSEIITLKDYRYEELAHDLKAGTISSTGKCNHKQASVVRAVQA